VVAAGVAGVGVIQEVGVAGEARVAAAVALGGALAEKRVVGQAAAAELEERGAAGFPGVR